MQKKKPETSPDYEDAIAELEDIVRQMESENLTLAQSLAAYKRGAALLKICQQSLNHAEQEVRIISETDQLTAYQLTAFSPDKE